MANRLTVNEMKSRVDALAKKAESSRDYESLEGEEHEIWQAALEAIRQGHPQSKAMANVALSTTNLEFHRGWGG